MPPQSLAEVREEPTRNCVVCLKVKPVSGVWYLLPPTRAARAAASFVCEACFRVQATAPVA